MKRNITINMFGSLYAIDEDAYELLNQYQNNMRSYFARQEGGEEIAEDIERRIAELFAELKATGVEAITIEHVQDIISRIGNPEQVDGEGTDSNGEENGNRPGVENKGESTRKKLFRNPDDKMLGGVCSGMACFFGIDALWLRLLMILLAWFSVGTMIVVYLILWLVIPETRTPEDRLRMQGRPVNLDNLRDEIVDNVRKAGQYAAKPETRQTAKGCLSKLLKGSLIFLILVVFLACIVGAVGYIFYFCANYLGYMSATTLLHDASRTFHIGQSVYWVIGASFVVLLTATIYLGIHLFARMLGRARPLSSTKRIILVVIWLVSAIVFFVSAFRGTVRYNFDKTTQRMERLAQRDSIQNSEQQEFLRREGWKVVRHKNGDTYAKSGEYYTGLRERQYLDTWSRDNTMEYEVEKTEKVAPGIYRLTAMARTDGHGCDIFARSDGKELRSAVPPYGNTGGELWMEARRMSEAAADTTRNADSTATLKLTGLWQNILDANGGKGFGWSRVTIDNITVGPDGTVTYGVSNARSGEWDGTWFSATDFRLEKTDAPAPQKNTPKRKAGSARHLPA